MVNQISGINLLVGNPQTHSARQAGGDGKAFGEMLTEAVDKISNLEKDSSAKQIAFAQGDNIELHEVVIAMEKYSIAMELMMAVRNKIVEAYQEISRMPV